LAQLADRMGLSVLPPGLDPRTATTDDVLATMADDGRRPFAAVRDADGPVMAEDAPVFGWVTDGDALPDGRWRAAPSLLVEQLSALRHDEAPLVLTPRRERKQMNAYLRFLQQRDDAPDCLVHPVDAARAVVGDGDRVLIGTESGAMEAIARVDATMRPGVVSVPHAWRTQSVNNLLSCRHDVDPLTGMPLMSGVPVTITRVQSDASV
jgi:anaerobic selenocysteine-containing dehydrogenase